MSALRNAFLACVAAATLVVFPSAGFAAGARHAGGSGHWGGHGHYGHSGHHGGTHWGWGLGLAVGVPWAFGWYDPYWGPAHYPSYAYGPVYPAPACAPGEECWMERSVRNEPMPPTTQVAPSVAGATGDPLQRPLHLNYCDSARAWFPQVRTCQGGWRFIRPEYNPAP